MFTRSTIARYTLDDAGNPVPCEDRATWEKWHETVFQERILAEDEVGDDVEDDSEGDVLVRTFFTGRDGTPPDGTEVDGPILADFFDHKVHRLGSVILDGYPEPLLWATYSKEGEEITLHARYSSRERALAGHEHAVRKVDFWIYCAHEEVDIEQYIEADPDDADGSDEFSTKDSHPSLTLALAF